MTFTSEQLQIVRNSQDEKIGVQQPVVQVSGLTWIIHQSRTKIAERVILQQLRQFCHPNTL
ncbi:hypothetical protein ACE09Y_04655 [Raphidiopsis sp. BLCC-F218]